MTKKRKPDIEHKVQVENYGGVEYKFFEDPVYGHIKFTDDGSIGIFMGSSRGSMFGIYDRGEIDTSIRMMREMVSLYDAYMILHPSEE